MTIEELNRLPAEEAASTLRGCADVDSWVAALVDARPYDDTDQLVGLALDRAAEWTDAEVEHALADHPRIGERPRGEAAGAAHSRQEQAGVDPADLERAARLADGNRRYEERFGRVYLVRAAGRSAEEMLDLLERRLDNDPVTEARETKRQLAEIAVLRLGRLLGAA